MKILLTGTSGQVGHAIQQRLRLHANRYALFAPSRIELDLSQPHTIDNVVNQIQPDLIIHPAAYTAVDRAEQESELAHLINAKAVDALASAAKRHNIGLLHFSTDYVFDGEKRDAHQMLQPYLEQDTTEPINVYGASKLAGENAIQTSGCRYLIFRTSWVYSMTGHNFLLTMLKLAREREQLRIVNDQFGTPTSAPWIAQVIHIILEQIYAANDAADWWQSHQGIYHLVPDGYTTWYDFAQAIILEAKKNNLLQKPAPVITGIPAREYPTPARRPTNSRLDNQALKQRFAIEVPDWQSALAECVQTACP